MLGICSKRSKTKPQRSYYYRREKAMKIKKILASVLGLALTASVFAGCSSGG